MNKIYLMISASILFLLPISKVFAKLLNPLNNINSLDEFLLALLRIVIVIAFPIVILMVVVSGFLFIKAQGNPEALKTAKKAILWTLIGGAIILGAELLALAISNTVGIIVAPMT